MTNMRKQFIKDMFDLIERKFNHLTDKERNDYIYLKNQKELSPKDFNKLQELSGSCKVRY